MRKAGANDPSSSAAAVIQLIAAVWALRFVVRFFFGEFPAGLTTIKPNWKTTIITVGTGVIFILISGPNMSRAEQSRNISEWFLDENSRMNESRRSSAASIMIKGAADEGIVPEFIEASEYCILRKSIMQYSTARKQADMVMVLKKRFL